MQHWYAYHSQKTMGHPYSSVGGSRFYIRSGYKQLAVGDWIWVVEGDVGMTRRFALVDCFEVAEIDRGPFVGGLSCFAVMARGSESRLRFPLGLNRADDWFGDLHARFITKQRFFSRLTDHPQLISGLKAIAGTEPN